MVLAEAERVSRRRLARMVELLRETPRGVGPLLDQIAVAQVHDDVLRQHRQEIDSGPHVGQRPRNKF